MTKRNNIIYWIATCWLALGMASTGLVQILQVKEEADMITQLGYPLYIMTILGIWKLAGVVAILIPKFPLLKEWAYAGFFFAMSGAILSHAANGDTDLKGFLAPLLLIVLTLTSWYFRPADRKTGTVAS